MEIIKPIPMPRKNLPAYLPKSAIYSSATLMTNDTQVITDQQWIISVCKNHPSQEAKRLQSHDFKIVTLYSLEIRIEIVAIAC